jgi:hypothetical protein
LHFQKGLWVTNGGYEYNLVLAAVAFALAAIGGLGAVISGRQYDRRRRPVPTQRPTTA